MSYKTIMNTGVLFFTIFIVGFSFAGGVVPSVAYAEDSYIVDVSYPSGDNSGNFFGNWGGDCCGSDILDVSYPWGDASGNDIIDVSSPWGNNIVDVSYPWGDTSGNDIIDVSYPWNSENDIVDVSYPFGNYIVDVSYPVSYQLGSNDIIDVSYPYYGKYKNIEIGGCGSSCGVGYYGGSYGNSFTGASSYASAHSYANAISKSTVQYIDKTQKHYNVQTINPFIPQPSCEIRQALPSGSNYGARLSWTSYSASSAYITNIGSVAVSGSQYVYPTVSTTYTMTVYGQGGSNTCSTTVQGYIQITPIPTAPTCELHYALPSGYNYGYGYNYGSGTLLSWSSTNASSAYLTNIGSVSVNGSQNVYPTITTTYSMTVYGVNGGSNTCSATIPVTQHIPPYVPPTSTPYCTISANPTTSQNGVGSTLSWSSHGATSATLSDSIGNVVLNGSLTVRPESSRVYTLTVRDNSGRTNTCFTTVSVYGTPYVSLTSIPYTGFDGGPMVQFIYWFSLVLFSGAAGYLVVNYRGGIQNVVSDLFSARSYAPAYITPDAVILNETIFAKEQAKEQKKEAVSEILVNEHLVTKAIMQKQNKEAETKDNMILESREGETPRLVINRC